MKYPSWGLQPQIKNEAAEEYDSKFKFDKSKSYLPRGEGRSYGDSCLNENGILILSRKQNHFISFDSQSGLLTCEAGVTFDDILQVFVPKGWFLPVTPGTKFITVGGAIANDIHGKNHHRVGNFGHFVKQIKLQRSSNEILELSEIQNPELFKATIGGLGLTGLILEVQFYLRPIKTSFIDQEQIRFSSFNEFLDLSKRSAETFEYTVAWVDCLSGKDLRGIFIQGNHSDFTAGSSMETLSGALRPHAPPRFRVPLFFPSWVLSAFTIRIFNFLYYWKNFRKYQKSRVHFEPFFYPLDAIADWNRIYGRRGFYQYQLVIPDGQDSVAQLKSIFELIKKSQRGSFLAVLKTFGNQKNKGALSFPCGGTTLSLDFANTPGVLDLFSQLEILVLKAGGRVYPAKDAHMSAAAFRAFYPSYSEFKTFIDPQFSSNFKRRIQL